MQNTERALSPSRFMELTQRSLLQVRQEHLRRGLLDSGTQRNLHRLGSGHPGARIPRPAGRQRGLRDTEPGGKLRGTDLGRGGHRLSRLDVPARERPAGMMLMTLSLERLHFLLPLNRGAHRGSGGKERWPERAALHLEPRLASPRAQRPLHSLTVVLTVPQLSPTWSQAGSSP